MSQKSPVTPSSLASPVEQKLLNQALTQFLNSDLPKISVWPARIAMILTFFGIVAASIGAIVLFRNPAKTPVVLSTYVYFEARVVDREGHPVAGAHISIDEQALGSTDSFGEWRKFLKSKLGSTVVMTVQKNDAQRPLQLSRNLVVPIQAPAQGDIQVKTYFELNTAENKSTPVAATPVVVTTPPVATTNPDAIQNASSQNFLKPIDQQRSQELEFKIFPRVLALLKNSDSKNNTNLSSKIRMLHLSVQGGQGLIWVEVANQNTDAQGDQKFLANYSDDSNRTASEIAQLVRGLLASKGIQPKKGDVWLELDFSTTLPENALVFVSGRQAQVVRGSRTQARFYGPASSDFNVTIVVDQKVFFRQRVVANKGVLRPMILTNKNRG